MEGRMDEWAGGFHKNKEAIPSVVEDLGLQDALIWGTAIGRGRDLKGEGPCDPI